VKRDKVTRTLPDTLGRRSSALGGSFADVSGAPADIATGAALMGLGCAGSLRRGLSLAVLTAGVPVADGKCECQKHNGRFWEWGSHGKPPTHLDSMHRWRIPGQIEKLGLRDWQNPNAEVAGPNGRQVVNSACIAMYCWQTGHYTRFRVLSGLPVIRPEL
jgi:hypothetical protein